MKTGLAEDYLHIISEEIEKLTKSEKDKLLGKLREEVDIIDSEIVKFLTKRINVSVEIGSIKKTIGLDTYDPRREYEIDDNINKLSEDPFVRKSLKRIYERIIDESRAVQREREK